MDKMLNLTFKQVRIVLLLLVLLFLIVGPLKSQTSYFNDDFGGNNASVGNSGDWWVMPEDATPMGDFPYTDSYEDSGLMSIYGQNPISLHIGGRYALTKSTGFFNTWIQTSDDHTIPDDDTRGYFAYFFLQSDSEKKTVYSTKIEVTPGMLGKSFSFNMWLKNFFGGPQFTLNVEGDGTIIKTSDISINSGDWTNFSLPFVIPDSYAEDSVAVSIILHEGDYRFGLDDISITEFNSSVTITSPAKEALSCDWNWPVFTAEFTVLDAEAYKWQYRPDSTGTWIDIPDNTSSGAQTEPPFGTLNTSSGTVTFGFQFLKDRNTGFYRLLVTQDANDYTNAFISNTIELITIDSDGITFTQTSGIGPDDPITITADHPGALGLPINYSWYENVANTQLSSNNIVTIPAFGDTIPASGTINFISDIYYVHLQYADNGCSMSKYPQITIDNNRMEEDFGTGTNPYVLRENAKNTYVIPGYTNIASDLENTPVLSSGQYLFTKQIYQSTGTAWVESITDHTGNNGYFLQVYSNMHNAEVSPVEFYKTTIDVCENAKYSFSTYIANPLPYSYHKLQFKFNVVFLDENGNQLGAERSGTTDGIANNTSDWTQYGFEFMVPTQAVKAICSIRSTGDLWNKSLKVFAMDDVKIEKLAPIQIVAPEESEINVISGTTVELSGIYASCASTVGSNYLWQKSYTGNDGDWSPADGINNTTTITSEAITQVVFYRFSAVDGVRFYSDPVKIIPIDISSMAKTYFVCPDNMTDAQTTEYRGYTGTYYPGMVPDEPGYLPSLIYMEVDGLYNVTYKWYEVATGGTSLDNVDEYDSTISFPTMDQVSRPVMLSDGKTNTLSVMNERNTAGIFVNRTYWVEICDMNEIPVPGVNRFPIYLEQAYLCGSTTDKNSPRPMVSPQNAKRIHRENFGGTSSSDPKIKTTPLTGIDYTQYIIDDDNLPEGSYMVTKLSPTLNNNGWTAMTDHVYSSNDPHGYLVVVNASETSGVLYTYEIKDLETCDDVNLVFTGWFASPVGWSGPEKANLKFKLTNSDTGAVLAEFTTGNLVDGENIWRQFGFMFERNKDVRNITLEIVTNNFGTGGGNDMVMDDIEIYLTIPPITLLPSLDSKICQENGETPSGIATLEGAYSDDGTLGKNLIYRWEYSTDAITWSSLGAQDENGDQISVGYGTITTGVLLQNQSTFIIDNFTVANDGYYRLVIAQPGAFDGGTPDYNCMGVSASRYLEFATQYAPFPLPTFDTTEANKMNLTAVCHNATEMSIVNFDVSENIGDEDIYADYYWIVDGVVVQRKGDANASADKFLLDLTNYTPGYHSVSLTVVNSADCDNTVTHNFLVYPKTTTWTAKGDVNNWNDYRNWSNGVPGDCTQAIIPNQSMNANDHVTLLSHYPVLINPTVEALNDDTYQKNQENLDKQRTAVNNTTFSLRSTCDTITFKMGAAVSRTDYLNYNFAKVDLDIFPNRWYTISAPLRDMYSGDYFTEGSIKRQNPIVYMRKFNATNPETQEHLGAGWSKSFNTLTEKLYSGLGYTIWVDDGNMSGQNVELQPFRFPKDSTEYTMWNYDGRYEGTVNIPAGGRDKIGRFTYEELIQMNGNLPDENAGTYFEITVKEDEATYLTTLVGNPFMSHLSFADFANENPAISNEGYYIWNGNSFDAQNPGSFSDQSVIAPMQSFVVKKTGLIEKFKFTFDMAAGVPASNGVLRSVQTAENPILRLGVLRDGIEHSNLRLKYDPNEGNAYKEEKDMWTMFSGSVKSSAVLYSLLEGKAASIRTIGDLSEPIELGIRTNKTGELTLQITGLEGLDNSYDIFLKDLTTNVSQDLRVNPEYTFNNQTGNVEGRLFLNIVKGNNTSIDRDDLSADSDLRIFGTDHSIRIFSAFNDPIQMVKIFSIRGELLHYNHAVENNTYNVKLPIQKGIFIVSVTTKLTQKNGKVILK